MIEIEQGVPLKEAKAGTAKPMFTELRHAMKQLLIDSSFFVPCKDQLEERYVRNCVFRLRIIEPAFKAWKLATRKVSENGQIGIRTWRQA